MGTQVLPSQDYIQREPSLFSVQQNVVKGLSGTGCYACAFTRLLLPRTLTLDRGLRKVGVVQLVRLLSRKTTPKTMMYGSKFFLFLTTFVFFLRLCQSQDLRCGDLNVGYVGDAVQGECCNSFAFYLIWSL